MDITEYCTSTIIPTNNDLNFVRFPSFTGYSELVLYASKTSSISSGIDELFPYFSVENLDPQCHMVILASRILDSIVVRIIDTDTIGSERLFLIQYGIIFSCELMEKAYMMFLYTDLGGDNHIYTSLPGDSLFTLRYHEGVFTVTNSLTDTVVFEKQCPYMIRPELRSDGSPRSVLSQVFTYVCDPLFSLPDDFFSEFRQLLIQRDISVEKIGENMFNIDTRHIEEREFEKLIGFLGIYTCILSDDVQETTQFMRVYEVSDGAFELPTTVQNFRSIDFMDPNWHRLRMGLLEISYLVSILEESQKNVEKGIHEIDNLGNPHILLQRKRLEIQDQAFDEVYPRYIRMRDRLISLLRYHIS